MAVKTKEEIMTQLGTYVGDDAGDEVLGLIQDISDTLDNGLQWISTTAYPLSFIEYSQATEDVANVRWLAMCFFKNYERGVGGEEARMSNAEYWYSYLQENPPQPWEDDGPTGRRKFKIMFYLKPYWKRF